MSASTEHPRLYEIMGKVQYNVLRKVSDLNKSRPKPQHNFFVRTVFNVLVFWAAKKLWGHFFEPTTPKLPSK